VSSKPSLTYHLFGPSVKGYLQ